MKIVGSTQISRFCLWTLLVFTLTTGSHAQELFQAATAGLSESRTTPADPTVVRRRAVLIETTSLPTPQSKPGQALTFNLFQDASITGVLDRLKSRGTGDYTWVGKLVGDDLGYFILVVKNNKVLVNIHSPARGHFQVRYVSGSLHETQEIDDNQFLPCGVDKQKTQSASKFSSPVKSAPVKTVADDGTLFDVMVVYTPAARVAAGGTSAMEALVQLAVDESNEAYLLSQINSQMRLVYQQEVTYTESGSASTDLNNLKNNGDGFMDEVHTLRNTYGADMVSLLMVNTNTCGLAFVMTTLSSTFEVSAFSVVSWNCAAANLSLAHELGHNMGCEHDIENALHPRDQSLYPYAYGWRFFGTNGVQYRTVMGQSPGTRISYFSNPNVTYAGVATGVDVGETNAAYNALVINNVALTVANWRTATVATVVANFTGSPTNGVAPLLVTFQDVSQGTITNRNWDFGDGSVTNITATNIVHSYSSPSTNTVRLIVSGASGISTNSRTDYISVRGPTPAQQSVTPSSRNFGSVLIGLTSIQTFQVVNTGELTLTGTPTVANAPSAPFSVLDASPYVLSASQTGTVRVSFAPVAAGAFSNGVVFSSNGGNTTNAITGTGVEPPPVASFSAVPTNGFVPLSVTFDDSSTGTITNRNWSFGDGTVTNLTATNFVYDYQSIGTNTVRLIVSGPSGAGTNTISNYIVVLPVPFAQLLAIPASRDFGAVAIGHTNSLAFQVINQGTLTLTGTTAVGGPFAISAGSTFSVAPSLTNQVTVSFLPVAEGTFSNSVSFTSNGGDSQNPVTGIGAFPVVAGFTATPTNGLAPLMVDFTDTSTGTITNRNWSFGDGSFTNINGTSLTHVYSSASTNTVRLIVSGPLGANTNTQVGLIIATNLPPPLLNVSPSTRDFGSLLVGQTNTLSFNVINPGGQALTGTATIAFAPAGPFSVNSGSPFNISAGGTGVVNVAFAPVTMGTFTNAVLFSSNAGSSTNTITGQGLTAGHLSVTPATVDFGSVITGATTQAAFVLTNSGGISVNGTASIGGIPFALVSGTPFNLAPFSGTNLVVSFSPTSVGGFTNAVSFTSTGGNTTNTVTGAGVTPPQLSVIPASLDFGSVATGTVSQASFVVTNLGGSALVGNATLQNASAVYSIPSGSSFNVQPAGSASVVIQFAPASVGSFTNSVLFASNGGQSTNAIAGSAAVRPTADFAAQPLAGLEPLPVSFEDNSTGTITNRFWDFGDGTTTNTQATSLLHTYTSGVYTVTLIASGPVSASTNTQGSYILVTHLSGPTPAFVGNPTLGKAPLSVFFVNQTVGSGLSFQWNFGDGGNSSDQFPTHVYSNAGTFTVSLTAIGSGATNTTTKTDYIVATNAAASDVTAPLLTVQNPTENQSFTNADISVTGTAADTSGIKTVTVNGSGATLVGTNWSRAFSLASGTNTLTVIATDNSANQNATTQTVHAILSAQDTGSNTNAPVVRITSPTNGFVTIERRVDVAGDVEDDTEVSSLVVTNHRGGSVVASVVGTNWTATSVSLRPGTNKLFAVATDGATNTASDAVTVIRINTNYVDTTLRATSATLTIGASSNSDSLAVAGVYNDAIFHFDSTNDAAEVMFGDYDGIAAPGTFKKLKFKAKASPTNTLTALSFVPKKRTFAFIATGFTLTIGDPFLLAIGLGTNDLGPDSISFGLPGNAVGKFAYAYGPQLPNVDQFFLGKSQLTTNSFALTGTLNVSEKPDPRVETVFFGIGSYNESMATNGWSKGAGNVYTYARPGGFAGAIQSMTLNYDLGTWNIQGSGADLAFLATNPNTTIDIEVGDFSASYPANLIPKGKKLSY